jgi:hypothetical protein
VSHDSCYNVGFAPPELLAMRIERHAPAVWILLWASASMSAGCSGRTVLQEDNAEGGSAAAPSPPTDSGVSESSVGDKDALQKEASEFDGNWSTYWESCDGSVDRGPPPGGTPECPSDLNLPGCPCAAPGMRAPCWTGERKNRSRGSCHDGITTCSSNAEFGSAWSDCEGEVLPVPDASSAEETCACFSNATWEIDNLWVCLWPKPPHFDGAMSTLPTHDAGIPGGCPAKNDADNGIKLGTPPPEPWSTNRLTADCAGVFTLCVTLIAGVADAPDSNDCQLARVCVDANYSTPGAVQPLPDLPSWISLDSACANRWWNVGARAELSVEGMSIECDPIAHHVFKTVVYCPGICSLEENRGLPECTPCYGSNPSPFGPED